MKIAFLTPEFPHPQTGVSGGIGTSIMNLCTGLVNLGHRPTVIVYGQSEDRHFEDRGISFYKVKNIKIKGLSWLFTRKKIQRLINRLHSEKKIDLVEAPDWTGISSYLKATCPIVVRLHGSDTYFCNLDGRPVKWWTRMHEEMALRRADGLLSVSAYTAKATNELFKLNRQFTVIPNGIDTSNFSNSEANKGINVLYFGTLIRKKGMLELPMIFNELFRINNSATLTLVGRDALDQVTGALSTWALMQPLFDHEAIKNVTYLGGVPYDQVKGLISEAAVCVFPTFAEALPVSWLESMAMGKPIVASSIGWAPEIVEDGKDGYLVDPRDHKSFAMRINALLSDTNLRSNIGIAARQKAVDRFDIGVVTQRNISFYNALIKK